MKKTSILIAVPTMGTLRAELCAWLQNQPHPHFLTIEISPFSRAMNTIMETFLKSDASYLLSVDSDTVPPPKTIEKLRKLIDDGAGVATAVTPIKRGNELSWNVYKEYADVEKVVDYVGNEPFPVVGFGSSCFMVSRETLEKIEKPYFRHLEFDNGNYCTGEMYFSDMLIKAGVKIMCDPSVKCDHFKTVGMSLKD